MTTISYRDGVMVGDGRMSLGDMIIKEDTTKVFWVNNHLVGVCGRARAISTFVTWLQKMTDYHIVNQEVGALVDLVPPTLEDDDGWTALVVTPNKQVLMYEGNTPIDMGTDIPMSIGSGSVFALAAMDAGANAEEAVKVAMKRDVYSGGTITIVQLEDEPEMIDKEKAMSMTKEELVAALFPEEVDNVDVTVSTAKLTSDETIVYIKKWDIDETIVLYRETDEERYYFEALGQELEDAEVTFSAGDMRDGCGFEKQELVSICAKMGLDVKSKDTYEKLTDKISKEVQRAIKDYEQSNM